MDALRMFGAYAADFEETFSDDNWERISNRFDPNISYVVTGSPYDCELKGRDAVLVGLKRALNGFDRRFEKREITASGEPTVEPGKVTFPAHCLYEKTGLSTLTFVLTETVEFNDDGLITLIHDDYPDGQDDVNEWLSSNKAEFDPTYE
jgi:hypothetical protein